MNYLFTSISSIDFFNIKKKKKSILLFNRLTRKTVVYIWLKQAPARHSKIVNHQCSIKIKSEKTCFRSRNCCGFWVHYFHFFINKKTLVLVGKHETHFCWWSNKHHRDHHPVLTVSATTNTLHRSARLVFLPSMQFAVLVYSDVYKKSHQPQSYVMGLWCLMPFFFNEYIIFFILQIKKDSVWNF